MRGKGDGAPENFKCEVTFSFKIKPQFARC